VTFDCLPYPQRTLSTVGQLTAAAGVNQLAFREQVEHNSETPVVANNALELHQFGNILETMNMKHGARNDITGKVSNVIHGDGVMSLAKVKVSGEFEMASVMTRESAMQLKLKKGDKVRVIVKAVNVLLVKDD
jgi:molybdopterin-binding protein